MDCGSYRTKFSQLRRKIKHKCMPVVYLETKDSITAPSDLKNSAIFLLYLFYNMTYDFVFLKSNS